MVEVSAVLEELGGRWLAESPDALGSVPVETTALGLLELAKSDRVRAILDDQPIAVLAKAPASKRAPRIARKASPARSR
jgi:hypothetical protein